MEQAYPARGKLEYLGHGLPESFLDVAMNCGIHLEHACGGSCACTTCHLIIRKGMENLSEMQDNEADRLDTAWELTTSSRLGCQAVIKGDVVAEFPMYTRNYVQEGGGIQLGQPDEKRIRKACGRADAVYIYTYQPRNAGPWWIKHGDDLARFDKLNVISIDTVSATTLADLCDRNMSLQCSIQEDGVYLSSESKEVELKLSVVKGSSSQP